MAHLTRTVWLLSGCVPLLSLGVEERGQNV